MSWRRALPALPLGLALVLAPAGTASAAPILDSADATELASTLAEASQAQGGICYGWQVEVTDPEGADGNEVGSSAGAGKAVDTVLCRSYVVLSAPGHLHVGAQRERGLGLLAPPDQLCRAEQRRPRPVRQPGRPSR